MALAFETTYGTPPVGGFTKMPFASTSLRAEQPLLNSELLSYGRDPLAPIKDAVTADGDDVVPLDPKVFGFWLPAEFARNTYRWRHLVENCFGKLKESRGIAMRSCKTDQSFQAFISIVATIIQIR